MSVLVPALALGAGVTGALLPRGKEVRQRLGLGVVAALTVWFVAALWASPSVVAAEGAAPEWPHLLNVLLGAPIVASVVVLFIPRQSLSILRGFTMTVFGGSFLLSLELLRTPIAAGWHHQYATPWIEAFGIRYHVAVDGISLWLILLTTFTTPIAAYVSFGSIKHRIKELCFAFLLLQGAMIGAFVALDLFLFYVFWELMLVPMYVMIGIWGGADKIKAAIKFFLYTMAGSVLMLAAIVYLVWTHQKLTGQLSFDYLSLVRVVLPRDAQNLCFWAFSLAFLIKVPMWPVHTWLPDAHVQAPTGGSIVLAAVMLKLGTYAYLRFSMGLFPGPASSFAPNLAGVAILGGIVYAALVAWKQSDIKRLVAYSSVAHLGYIMLGLFGATPAGMSGAILQMINHGISTGALFLLVGVLYDRRHTRLVEEFGGIAKVMPVFAALFVIVTFASVGVPGTNGFVGEFMVIMGTAVSERLGPFAGIHAAGAAFGVILAAVYMLSVVQKTFFGPLTNPKNRHLSDISGREILAVSPLIVMVFVIGFFPRIFLDRMEPSIRMAHATFVDASTAHIQMTDESRARLLPEDTLPKAFLRGAPALPSKEPPPAPAEAPEAAAAAPAPADAATPRPQRPPALKAPIPRGRAVQVGGDQ